MPKPMRRANGQGTVYKLQGRRRRPWVAAKNKVIIGYYERKSDALDALTHYVDVRVTTDYNLTFAEVFERWRDEHYRSVSKSSAAVYDTSFRAFAPLHGRRFRDLRAIDYQRVIDDHSDMSYSTLSKYKQLVSQMSQWAMREEILTTNYAVYIKLPAAPKKERETFSAEDIAKLTADGSEAARIVLMLIYTGMRIGELFALPLCDYHETYVVGGEKTNAGKNRVIPIRPEGREHFSYFAWCADGELLLSGYVGQHDKDNYRKRDYYPLLDRLGIERLTPHATRHTYASWAASSGMRPEVLQKILGHADYSTTADIYVHLTTDDLVAAVDDLTDNDRAKGQQTGL